MGQNTVTVPGDLSLTLVYPDEQSLADTVQTLVDDQVASKIAAKDATLWGPDAESESSIRLSWVSLAESSRPLLAPIAALKAELAAEGVDHVVLAGMGGSSLAPEVIANTAGVPLVTLDTTDAEQVRAAISTDLARTVLVVSSKSGGTVETDSHRRAYEKAFTEAGIDPKSRIVVVTDPGSPLSKLAEEAGYRKVFLADPHVGGRYSALTAFGLVPSGLAGVDIEGLLDEAAAAAEGLSVDSADNAGVRLGALIGLAQLASAEKIVLADNGSGIVGFGDWAEQLIAESTGKLGKGVLPVVVEGVTAPGFADAKADAVLVTLGAQDTDHRPASGYGAAVSGPLGAQMLLWEYATVVASRLIGINPFDQPDVETAKIATRALLDTPPGSGEAPTPVATDGAVEIYGDAALLAGVTTVSGAVDALLAAAPEAGYLSIQAYLDRLGESDSGAGELRSTLAARSGLQTTFGWGPRFLHSTGQYHKGGHPNGVFLQLSGATVDDLDVPDRPYTFATLQLAQAQGDGSVLAGHGRPVVRLHLTDRVAGLTQLKAALG
ncbi:glucose-6-phosphate isomerase [Nakamurella silvestris]|nr:glucose-6-phosphate isomerase [Nakamurella silvestris]